MRFFEKLKKTSTSEFAPIQKHIEVKLPTPSAEERASLEAIGISIQGETKVVAGETLPVDPWRTPQLSLGTLSVGWKRVYTGGVYMKFSMR